MTIDSANSRFRTACSTGAHNYSMPWYSSCHRVSRSEPAPLGKLILPLSGIVTHVPSNQAGLSLPGLHNGRSAPVG